MPINIQLEPLLRTKKKEQNVLKLFLLAFQETPTILYIKTTNEDGGGVFIDDQSRGLSPTDF
jgi:hypothetical protein